MIFRTLLLAAAAACLLPAHAADTPGSNPSVRAPSTNDRLVTARRLIEVKDWGSAVRELNLAVRDDPRNADVHNLLGYSLRKQGTPDLPKAIEHYQTAIKLNPQHKGAHEYIGEAYLMDKKPAEAEKHLAELEKICGNKTCEEYQDLAKAVAQYKAKN